MDSCSTLLFSKYQGAGNDFIMVDNLNNDYSFLTDNSKLILQLCDRNFGIGADGLIEILKDSGSDFYMKYYNANGTDSTLCGNGARCAVLFCYKKKIVTEPDDCKFTACDGAHAATIVDPDRNKAEGLVEVHMADVEDIDCITEGDYLLNTGSPHYVRFVESVKHRNVENEGRDIRYSKTYKEKGGVNVNFVEVDVTSGLHVRTYERGVEAETLACGTGAVAAALAYHWKTRHALTDVRNNDCSNTRFETESKETCGVSTVIMPGGQLSVKYSFGQTNRSMFKNIWLCGPAKEVFMGEIVIDRKW